MKKLFITIISLSILLISCKGGDKSEKTTEDTIKGSEDKVVIAICLLDNLSIRETPSAKGKWITSMSLGEKVMFTEEETTDAVSKKVYYKVKLTDGKEGWTRATFLAVNGAVGAMLEEASVYKRPDLLTKTDKKYSIMDIIAVTENKVDWMKVKGRRTEGEYIEEGWIKSSNISNDEIDIATAKFARSAMSKSTMTERIKALEEVINNQDLSSSKFINVLKSKIEDYKAKNVAIDVNDVKVEEEAK